MQMIEHKEQRSLWTLILKLTLKKTLDSAETVDSKKEEGILGKNWRAA